MVVKDFWFYKKKTNALRQHLLTNNTRLIHHKVVSCITTVIARQAVCWSFFIHTRDHIRYHHDENDVLWKNYIL